MGILDEILEDIGKTYSLKDQGEWLKDHSQYKLRDAIQETARYIKTVNLDYQVLEHSGLDRTIKKLEEAKNAFLQQAGRTRDKRKLTATVSKLKAATNAMIEVKIQNNKASRILDETLKLANR